MRQPPARSREPRFPLSLVNRFVIRQEKLAHRGIEGFGLRPPTGHNFGRNGPRGVVPKPKPKNALVVLFVLHGGLATR
jgi:hypothetical protein